MTATRLRTGRRRPRLRSFDDLLTYATWFCGAGGDTSGAAAVPGVEVVFGANHNKTALATHTRNFPDAQHWRGDIRDAPVHRWPVVKIHWSSPMCPDFGEAKGVKRTFDQSLQSELPLGVEPLAREDAERSRALMWEIPQYLAGVQDRGGLVMGGVVENVPGARAWDQWDAWTRAFRVLGYLGRLVAFNSMHAVAPNTPTPPQSRDRLYWVYWHESLGRSPDFDKWLRPRAWCAACDAHVDAVQVFKDPRKDMGRYGVRHGQYYYRCPRVTCRNAVVEPDVRPAYSVIDFTRDIVAIGDRKAAGLRKLSTATLNRVAAGITKHARPYTEAGGVVPPLLTAASGSDSGALLPLVVPLRGGGDREQARPVSAPLHTITAGGNHHYLACVPTDVTPILIPYYRNGNARPVTMPVGTFTTKDRWALAIPEPGSVDVAARGDLSRVLYRMLEPDEIGLGMGFHAEYEVLGNRGQQVRQYGNAVTPAVAEILVSALVEAIEGIELPRHHYGLAV